MAKTYTPRCPVFFCTRLPTTPAMALAFVSVDTGLNDFRLVSREAAARQGMEQLWDELHRKVAVVYRDDALYADIQDMLHACAGEASPGAMPVADWLIHLHATAREPPSGIDIALLGDIRARRAARKAPPPSPSPTPDADVDMISADVENYIAAEIGPSVTVAYAM
jgi:hypothetical protein